ncbi:MAG: apolipoprotein N-acyltransferase [Candidatus Firestonebacteria bacterium RIFOXYC2_FULL_39_67]|nr:MAG: apolipoprotein N-acyltransferase [Candidatus Firestonebacteria bacterium RIFOXYD2_FULL_39_29]OGF56271.1 MAG: apolipoprotein N-acyltransferase [Candidatus Firestonebacteria bacterium RIFOXYC2_FULL_39_67]
MKFKEYILAIVSGLFLVVSFPSFINMSLNGWSGWFAFVGLVPLLIVIQGKTKKQAFLLGCITGFIYLGGAVYWLNFMKELGILAFPAWLLLGTYLSLFIGLFCVLTVLTGLVYAPFIWVGVELLRTYLLTGFPWALLGYSQFKFLPLIQIADITGVFGVSFVLVLFNTGIALIHIKRKEGIKKRFLLIFAGIFVLVIFLLYGFIKLHIYGEKNETGHIFTVIQGNISQTAKWDQNYVDFAFSTHENLSLESKNDFPEVIIWPETATAMYVKYMPVYWAKLQSLAKVVNADLLVGSPDAVPDKDLSVKEAYNSVFHFSKYGNFTGKYAKMHLVPFGEYVPFEKQLKFLEKYTAGFNKWEKGRKEVVFTTSNGLEISTPVCWEVIFPQDCRRFVVEGAKYLITVSNDGWYGVSSAPHQHFMVLPFRAVENRVSVGRAANTTLSGFVDYTGKIKNTLGLFERNKLSIALPSCGEGLTFYTKFGDVFSYICVMVALFGIFLGLKGKEWKKKKS